MPTVFSSTPGSSIGYLTPRVGPGAPALTGAAAPPELSPQQKEQLTQKLFNAHAMEDPNRSWYRGLADTVAGAGVDLADTALSSAWDMTPMGLVGVPGPERGDTWNFIGDYGGGVGSELKNYYAMHQSRIELMSGLTGAVATGYLGGEILLPRLSNALAKSSALNQSWLWKAGARVNSMARSRMNAAQAEAAMNQEVLKLFNPARLKFYGVQAAKGAGKAAFEEALIGATMHTNQAIWSDDMSDNMLFGALGIGVGGAFGLGAARYEMRRLANDPAILAKRADAVDPQGFTSLRERQPDAATMMQMRNLDAKESTNFTALMLEARQQTPENATPAIINRFEQNRDKAIEQASQSLQKITTKGIEGIPATRFNVKEGDRALDGSAGQHVINYAYERDPIALHALDSIGIMRPVRPADKKSPLAIMLDDREGFEEDLIKSEIPSNIKQGKRLNKQQPMVLYNGEAWLPVKGQPDAIDASWYTPGQIQLKAGTKGVSDFNVTMRSGTNVRINELFNPIVARGARSVASLPMNEFLQMNEATRTVMGVMLRRGEGHVVPANPNWYQLDAAIEFERRGGHVEWNKTGVKNRDEAQIESLRLKAKEIGDKPIGSYWDRLRYNLPLPSTAERAYDMNGDSIREILTGAARGLTIPQLKELRKQIMDISGFELRTADPELHGDMFRWNLTEGGKWRQPVIGYFDSAKVNRPLDPMQIAQGMAEIKAARFQILTTRQPNAPAYGFVPEITQALTSSPGFTASMSVRGMADDQATGLGNVLTQAAGEVLTREMRYRDQKTLLNLLSVSEMKNRLTDDSLNELTKGLVPIRNQLNSAAGAASRSLVNQFFSLASGWDIKAIVNRGDDFAFELANTENNAARLGRSVDKGELLMNQNTGAEVIADGLAMSYLDAFQDVAEHIRQDLNRTRRALGLKEISKKPFYVPPPDTTNKFVGFTFDPFNNVVPGGAIVADTQAEFERLQTLKFKELTSKPGFTFRTKAQLASLPDLFEQAAMDWINPGMAYAPKKAQRGGLSSDRINPNAIGDSLAWVKRMHEQNMTNIMRSLYDSQLGIVRARGAVERLARNIPESSPLRTIWDEYEATVLGKNLADMQRSVSGPLMKAVESKINMGLAASWPAMRWMSPVQLSKWTADLLERSGVKIPGRGPATYQKLVDQLGPHAPYASAVEYAEQNFKVIRPPEIREISQKLNRMSAALILRYFEIPMAAMNMLGIITTMPSILRSGKAPITTFVNAGTKKVGVIDATKIMMQSMRDLTRKTRHADWDHMVKHGDATQQVADFNKAMSTIEDRSTFNRIMLGDRTVPAKNVLDVRSVKDVKDIFKNKGVDGLISVLTDTTEDWSRTWAHFAGLRLADLQGITGLEARHSFAREVANSAIANYNPMNRPELYQSAFGSMFGLFMSYMQSYNQRLFRWMETGDYMSIGRQLGMQSTLFGVGSLPGFNAIQQALLVAGLTETEDGDEATLMDHIYAKLGPEVGAAFAHGGLDQFGIALYTRGDMNYRDLTLDPTRLMAGLGVVKSGASAVMESYKHLASADSLDNNNRLSEILARNMPNRVLKGIMTQFANGGAETDATGQIVSENRNFFETALRMAGVRSTYQQGRIDAFYASKQLKAREAARMDTLRVETRALIRNDPNWKERIQEIFDKHVEAGGRPEHFRTWIQDQVRAATTRRDVRDLQSALRNPKNQLDVWRYNAYAPD